MFHLYQHFPASRSLDFTTAIREEFERTSIGTELKPGMRIAVGVGSRGITNLAEIVIAVLGQIRAAGADPFIVPAMGSHGGATPDGQQNVLAEFGVTPETMHVHFETSMEVKEIGRFLDDYPVVFSTAALKADGIVIINRVKPHTDFFGNLGSGLQKMLAIGFGKHAGATNAHRAASRLGHERVIRETAKVILNTVPVLFGVAILEDQHHQTHSIQVVPSNDIPKEEAIMFSKAQELLPRLPFSAIDLLIIDEIGKEISGTGMDTNVIGRGVLGYFAELQSTETTRPHISRIFVRDLTAATNGNGIGIGLADFTTTRLVNAINRDYMYTNALTSLGLPTAKIPMYFDKDSEAISHAVSSLAMTSSSELKIVWIRNTLSLDHMLVSERLAADAANEPSLEIKEQPQRWDFDKDGNLLRF
jgi:hypothetical protein